MIEKITFTQFGKFQQQEFNLGPITVVHGLNEAGKTTFFDGLFQSVCKPSETKKAGKLLKNRYGAGRMVSVLYTNKNGDPNISEDAFLNLYAIRAGDLKLEWSQGSDWMEKLKAKLFHGGLDPKLFIDEFEKRSSDKKTFVHNRELDHARLKKENAKNILEKLKSERDSLLYKEKTLVQLEKSLQHAQSQRLENEQKIIQFEKTLNFEDRILQRQKLVAQISKCVDYEKWQAEWESLSLWRNVKRDDFETQHLSLSVVQEELKAARIKHTYQNELIMVAESESQKLKTNLENATANLVVAERISSEIKNALLQKSHSHHPFWWAVSLASILSILGLITVFFQRNGLGYSVFGSTLVFATTALVIGWRRKKYLLTGKWESELKKWQEEWESITSQQFLKTDSIESFLIDLQKVQSEKEINARQVSDSLERLLALKTSVKEMQAEVTRLEKAQTVATNEEKKWFENLGIKSGDEFLGRFSKLAETENQLKQAHVALLNSFPDLNLNPEIAKNGDSFIKSDLDVAELIREVNRKLNVLDEEGIPSLGRDDASLQRLKREYQECKIEKEKWAQKERTEISETAVLTGAVGESLGKLTEEIVTAEDAMAFTHNEVKAKELDKKAALLALDIFKKLGSDTQFLWKTLAKEIQRMLEPILTSERLVHFDGLSNEQMQFQDVTGASRSLENLSTGTKDLLVLAARLALAENTRTEPGLLVLDEPFLSLDVNRELGALEMLKSFHHRTSWQIVLFTKDLSLSKNLLQFFPFATQINLSPG